MTTQTEDLLKRLQAATAPVHASFTETKLTAEAESNLQQLLAGKIPAGFKDATLSDKASEQITKKAGKKWTPSRVLMKSSKQIVAFWIEFNYNSKNPLAQGVIGQYYFDGGAAYATIVIEGAAKKYLKMGASELTKAADSKDLDMGVLMDAFSKCIDLAEIYDIIDADLTKLGAALNTLFVKKTRKQYDALAAQ